MAVECYTSDRIGAGRGFRGENIDALWRGDSAAAFPVGPPDAVVAVVNVEAPWAAAFSIRDYDNVTKLVRKAAATFPEPAG